MSVVVEIVTRRRRVIDYLWSPIAKAVSEAGRERCANGFLADSPEVECRQAKAVRKIAIGEAPAHHARGTVLLVDDEAIVRLTTADMLTDLGYEVIEADSAESALQLCRDGVQADLLVTDHLMPGKTGTELARELQALTPHLPVLVVSGYAEAEGLDPALPRLTKPFKLDELAARLAQINPGVAQS